MLSLTKKSDAQPVAAPAWHANFRNFERLPDTKVVRTTFFINTAAIAIASVMLLWVGSRELNNYTIREQIDEAQRVIAANQEQNAEAIRQSATFTEEQKKMSEAVEFVRTPISVVEFLDILGKTLPREVVVDTVDARLADQKSAAYQIRGRVAGSPDRASGIASSFVDMLRAEPRLAAVFSPITLNRIDRDSSGTFLIFDITLTLKTK